MSKFFDSEIVREELKEINQLQESIYGALFSFSGMSRESQVEHIDMLVDLLERQKVMYTRLSLSDDPEAKQMKDNIQSGAKQMGLPKDVDVQVLFKQMGEMVNLMRDTLDYQ